MDLGYIVAFDRQNPHYKGFSVINILKGKQTPGKRSGFLSLSVSVLVTLGFWGRPFRLAITAAISTQ